MFACLRDLRDLRAPEALDAFTEEMLLKWHLAGLCIHLVKNVGNPDSPELNKY